MKLFEGKQKRAARVQLRHSDTQPFGLLEGYVPLGDQSIRLYRSIREAVPVVDAAILKLIRLTGGFTVSCTDKKAEAELSEFVRSVDVGRGQRGLDAFIAQYLDSMLTCGRAVGEIVTEGTRDIRAVICGSVEDIVIREGESPLSFELCLADGTGQPLPLP